MNGDFVNRLHAYLRDNHLRSGALLGPDPGVRFNYRLWRFLKSALRFIRWRDDLCYLQAQGYWILANWRLSSSPNDSWAKLAIDCSDYVIAVQRKDGAWDYPNPEWRNRVATVEGIWASLGLLQTFQQTGHAKYLDSVLRWHQFFESQIGFQPGPAGIAVNYFAHDASAPVPNNSALAMRYLARLDQARQSTEHQSRLDGLRDFLQAAQLAGGELPYELSNPRLQHFQCFQYHGFILLDLLDYYQVTQDQKILTIIHGVAQFLQSGITHDGNVQYQCGVRHRFVNYHAAAVFAALKQWSSIPAVIDSFRKSGREMESLETSLNQLLAQLQHRQRTDGSLPHSRGDYRVLSDQRSYPRYLAMILQHALLGLDLEQQANPAQTRAPKSTGQLLV